VAEEYDVQVAIHADTLNEAGFVDDRRRLGTMFPDLLSDENKMYSAGGGGRRGLHKHDQAGGVAVLEPKGFDRLRDLRQVLAPDDDIDVFGQAAGVRRRFFNVQVSGQSSDDAVFQPGGGEGLVHKTGEVEELLHAFLRKTC
jgi:hypothetical protein